MLLCVLMQIAKLRTCMLSLLRKFMVFRMRCKQIYNLVINRNSAVQYMSLNISSYKASELDRLHSTYSVTELFQNYLVILVNYKAN